MLFPFLDEADECAVYDQRPDFLFELFLFRVGEVEPEYFFELEVALGLKLLH